MSSLSSSLLLAEVPKEDFPILRDAPEYFPQRLGLTLLEFYGIQGMRLAVFTGYACSLVYYFFGVRWRLPFAERSLHPLHHYFYPSAAYSAPIGLVGGALYGYDYESRHYFSPEALEEARLQQIVEQQEATAKGQQERFIQEVVDRAVRHLEERQSWREVVTRWVAPSEYRRRREEKLTELVGEEAMRRASDWTLFLEPYSLRWVELQTKVQNPTHYRNVAEGVEGAIPFTQLQVEQLVSRVLLRRLDKDENRWTRTTARFGFYGGVAGLLLWNSGGLSFRFVLGVGNGVALGSLFSALGTEDTFQYV